MRAAPLRRREGLPLAPNEERFVLAEVTSSLIYGNPWTMRIRGRLDARRLEAAIVATCQRHDSWRAGYELGSDGCAIRATREAEALSDA